MGAPLALKVGLASAVLTVAIAAVLVPSGSLARDGGRVKRAERVVLRALAGDLPDDRRVRCARKRGRRVAACRWRAGRRLSPNRTRSCKGRYRVALRPGRARILRPRRRSCRLRVAPVDPRFGFSDISIGLGRVSPERAAELAEGVGAGVFRVPFDWRWAERTRDTYELGIYDRTYDAMLERGIRPLFVLAGAPRWAWPPLTLCPSTCVVPPASEFDRDWREIAAILARRYPRAAAIEVWNEPNELTFWRTGANPGRYTELLQQAYTTIKEANPSMTVIGGAGNRVTEESGSIGGLRFLREVLGMGGTAFLDGISVHPYAGGGDLEWLLSQLSATRRAASGAGRSGIPLWVTEFGYSTTGPSDWDLHASEDEQAARLQAAYRTLAPEGDLRTIIFQSLVDWYDDRANPNAGFGVLRGDLSPKPAYCGLRSAVGVPGPCP